MQEANDTKYNSYGNLYPYINSFVLLAHCAQLLFFFYCKEYSTPWIKFNNIDIQTIIYLDFESPRIKKYHVQLELSRSNKKTSAHGRLCYSQCGPIVQQGKHTIFTMTIKLIQEFEKNVKIMKNSGGEIRTR